MIYSCLSLNPIESLKMRQFWENNPNYNLRYGFLGLHEDKPLLQAIFHYACNACFFHLSREEKKHAFQQKIAFDYLTSWYSDEPGTNFTIVNVIASLQLISIFLIK